MESRVGLDVIVTSRVPGSLGFRFHSRIWGHLEPESSRTALLHAPTEAFIHPQQASIEPCSALGDGLGSGNTNGNKRQVTASWEGKQHDQCKDEGRRWVGATSSARVKGRNSKASEGFLEEDMPQLRLEG